jgi:uncharacterized protein YndB with AHSA1/START domain
MVVLMVFVVAWRPTAPDGKTRKGDGVEASPVVPTAAPDREIVSAREFDAPRERVFAAWTDPALLARWWGPKGFTNTFEEFDLRPGGHWRFTMRGPDGTAYPQESVFVEVVRPERVVFDHLGDHRYRAVITFAERGDRTGVTFRMIHATVEECDRVRPFVVEGNEQNFDRLQDVLAGAK